MAASGSLGDGMLRRATSFSISTSGGEQLAFFRMENAIRRSSGVLKYSSRSSGLPAPGRLSNTPCSIASRMRASAMLRSDIRI